MSSGRREGPSNVEVVRDAWHAHNEGRIDDMIELLDRDVRWLPMFRPGRTVYIGRDGVRQMLADAHSSHDGYRLELDEIIEPDPDLIVGRGRVHSVDAQGAEVVEELEVTIQMRDGLILRVETNALPPPPL